ncbi:MAG: type II toxin-antitoxin system MqsA family antitoxin [Proteobacteria bacterium]|nr:type II toxin-antitoxin system MqsA family antitoxin [Pseudomonadota bacterium]
MAPMDTALRELRAEIAKQTSHKVRKLRERAGLSQRRAGHLLGGGPRAFQKYETGQVEPSVAVLNLLTLIANDPSRLDELMSADMAERPAYPAFARAHSAAAAAAPSRRI